ncbi:NUDIX domain-containing protein [Paenibacillus sp. 481]|uniref:NUDIX domain-containing protein n=1 Tax=Paenibacillus sp. 481 TaxID=2835869 RepID=UPI001E5060F1|nr:NUDIX domain-containing protein [Paenibacillus sp. 481]UHA72787.1 NUDIX domain-containing protein [Paenibacillus sp. 481]
MKSIRNAAKAVIIQEDHVLLTRNVDQDGHYYLFPGGGQENGEELRDTVIRECMEELGCEVEIRDLIHLREYIGKNHQFSVGGADFHQVEFYFSARLIGEPESFQGTNIDEKQDGVEWIPLDTIDELRVYPYQLALLLKKRQTLPTYLGDTN